MILILEGCKPLAELTHLQSWKAQVGFRPPGARPCDGIREKATVVCLPHSWSYHALCLPLRLPITHGGTGSSSQF